MPTSLSAPLVGASTGRNMAPVVTAASFAVAPEFGYVVLTASASVVLTQWQMIQVLLDLALLFGFSFRFKLLHYSVSVVSGCDGALWVDADAGELPMHVDSLFLCVLCILCIQGIFRPTLGFNIALGLWKAADAYIEKTPRKPR